MSTPPTNPSPDPERLALFDLSSLESAFAANRFDQEEVVSLLIGHARQTLKPQVSVQALSLLMNYTRQCLQLSGVLVKDTIQETTSHGELTLTRTRLAARTAALTSRRPSSGALPHARVISALPSSPDSPEPLSRDEARPGPSPADDAGPAALPGDADA